MPDGKVRSKAVSETGALLALETPFKVNPS